MATANGLKSRAPCVCRLWPGIALVVAVVACKEPPPEPTEGPVVVQVKVDPRPPSPVFSSSAEQAPEQVDGAALTPGFVRIPAGRYDMGSPGLELKRSPDEVQHPVRISRAFEMQATEVTQAEYTALMGRNPAYHSECGEACPVEQVSWYDALRYCNTLSGRRGMKPCYTIKGTQVSFDGPGCLGFRLPSEAEWEYAARAGSVEPTYGPVHEVAWIDRNSGMKPHPVATRRVNAWGLYDMLGNVFEWTWDWMDDYPRVLNTDPLGPPSGDNKVFRGGAYRWTDGEARHAFRNAYGPANKVEFIGFRCVRTLQTGGGS